MSHSYCHTSSSRSPSSQSPSYSTVLLFPFSHSTRCQDMAASAHRRLRWSMQRLQYLHHHLRRSTARLLHPRHEPTRPILRQPNLHLIHVLKISKRYLPFHSAFGKSRSFKLDDLDQCQTFEVVFPFEIRQAFQVKYKSRFNQKLAGKAYNTSIISNPIPEMLNEEDYKDLE